MIFTPYSIWMRILGAKLFLVNVNQDGMSVFKYVVMTTVVLGDSTWPQNAGAQCSILTDEQHFKAEVLNVRTHHASHPQTAVESKPGNVTDPYISIRVLNSPQCLNTRTSYVRGSGYKLGRLLWPRIFCSRSKKSSDYFNYHVLPDSLFTNDANFQS